ncbi:ribosome recycling factor [Kaustia mangrovi]|uniref:Ribosome-recycling factor n=1 Tax=Kaustia mangrovi TaxID=2593653 RepID=A0A7S8HAV1_9HYPH|nr:ribosome recycling factor [Kaustia mangrovi]QPC41473.1 ribosome recycling factor [Kaustia mangrovi]
MTDQATFSLKDLKRRMHGAVSVLKEEFSGLRTGRASVHLLEPITVEAYGSTMPLNQVGNVSVPEPRMLTVQIWDKSLVSAAEKAIRNSSLGLNPMVEGQLIRVPVPELSQERRKELAKVAAQYAEQARVAVRNVRRDGMEQLKRLEKDGEIGQDEHRGQADEVQKLTDATIKEIDEALEHKESEIMQI